MYQLQDKPGSISIGEAFIKDRDTRDDDKGSVKTLIKQANSVDIAAVLKTYGLKLDEYNKKCKCPFSFHTNDKTASFTLYKNTNSFYCFGCKSGGGAVNFISLFEKISKEQAALKIASKYNINTSVNLDDDTSFMDRRMLFLEFSDLIRNFIFDNLDDKSALAYSEKVTLIFDTINFKHNLDNTGLKLLIRKLQVKLEQYKCQQQ